MAISASSIAITDSDIATQRPGRAIDELSATLASITAGTETLTLSFPTAYDVAPTVRSAVVASTAGSVVTSLKSVSTSALYLKVTANASATGSVKVLLQRNLD